MLQELASVRSLLLIQVGAIDLDQQRLERFSPKSDLRV